MKKTVIILLIASLLTAIIGCGGSSSTRYTYEWKPISVNSLKMNSMNISTFNTSGFNTNPIASVSLKSSTPQTIPDIYVYRVSGARKTLVSPSWSVDEDAGYIQASEITGSTQYYPTKIGSQIITASIDDTTLTIPVFVYPFIGLNVNGELGMEKGFDFDSLSWTNDSNSADMYIDSDTGILYTPFGSQSSSYTQLSDVLSPPTSGYSTLSIDTNDFNTSIIFIETSDSKYAKLQMAFNGNQTYYGYGVGYQFLVSNESGSFDY